LRIMEAVKREVKVPQPDDVSVTIKATTTTTSTPLLNNRSRESSDELDVVRSPYTRSHWQQRPPSQQFTALSRLSSLCTVVASDPIPQQQQQQHYNYHSINSNNTTTTTTNNNNNAYGKGRNWQQLRRQLRSSTQQQQRLHRTRFVVFDFQQVTGCDATAVRSCFLILRQLFRSHGITMVCAGLKTSVEYLLRQNHVLDAVGDRSNVSIEGEVLGYATPSSPSVRRGSAPKLGNNNNNSNNNNNNDVGGCHVAATLNDGIEWCETELLRMTLAEAGINMQPVGATAQSCADILLEYVVAPPTTSNNNNNNNNNNNSLSPPRDVDPTITADTQHLSTFFEQQRYQSGSIIFRPDATSTSLFLLISGEVSLSLPVANSDAAPSAAPVRLVETLRPGTIFGEMDFTLQQVRTFLARAETDVVVSVLRRSVLLVIEREHPELGSLLHKILVTSLSLQMLTVEGLI